MHKSKIEYLSSVMVGKKVVKVEVASYIGTNEFGDCRIVMEDGTVVEFCSAMDELDVTVTEKGVK